MAQIILKNGKNIEAKESTEELFGLIQGDEQFIIINTRQVLEVYVNEYMNDTSVEWWKIALNKNHIEQVF